MANVLIEVDNDSGFCFGVTSAINKAEAELASGQTLYCLGDIVHNSDEVERLQTKGLITISHDDLANLRNVKLLLRAHGEPPSTYETARRNNIEIIDATCPVVLQLQRRIKSSYDCDTNSQIVIYGKTGHAEVNGLVGQTDGKAIVVEDETHLERIDFSRPIAVYSQTTKPLDGYRKMCERIREMAQSSVVCHDTICRQVANRASRIRLFARQHDVVLFVCGKKSSNGHVLFEQCHQSNNRSFLISNPSEIKADWLKNASTIGICGATSTPRWLMEDVKIAAAQITSADQSEAHE